MKVREVFLALLVLIALGVLGLFVGAYRDAPWELILELRVPRILLAAAVGAALSVSGLLLQTTFQNPLCEPYTLGISSGAALGAALGSALGWTGGYAGLALPALVGAGAFLCILLWASRRLGAGTDRLLLFGVLLGLLGSSGVAIAMTALDPAGLQAAFAWLLGDLSRAEPHGAFLVLAAVAVLLSLAFSFSRDFDGLLLGWEGARGVGLEPKRGVRRALLLSSALTALAVGSAGMVGFAGLLIPHLARARGGSLHASSLPLAAVWGAAALVGADALTRALSQFLPSGAELPIGVVTTVVGSPFLILLLARGKR